MYREIKFRAFNRKTKKMIVALENLEFHDSFFTAWDGWKKEHLEQEDIALMQYVGLRDLNNRDIYEGDIVKIDNVNYPDALIEVFFEEGAFCLRMIDVVPLDDTEESVVSFHRAIFEAESLGIIFKCTIVGNIYENKDLLNYKNN